MDHARFRALVRELYRTVDELERMFPGRSFTPDGHLVGSLGEAIVADAYGLTLMTASNEGYDAVAIDGRKVEIKATQARSVAFRSCPEHVIAIRIGRGGEWEEIYNGSGSRVWERFNGKPLPKNGQYAILLSTLRKLHDDGPEDERIPRAV